MAIFPAPPAAVFGSRLILDRDWTIQNDSTRVISLDGVIYTQTDTGAIWVQTKKGGPSTLVISRNEVLDLLSLKDPTPTPTQILEKATFRRWRAALGGRTSDPATILWLGDSIMALDTTPTATDDQRIPRKVTATLQDRLMGARGGRGYYPARIVGPGVTTSPWAHSTGVLASATYGLGRISAQLTASTHTMTITVPDCDRFDLCFAAWVGVTGVATVAIDGGAAVNVDTAALSGGGFRAGRRWSSGALAPGNHTVVVGWASGGPVRLEGLMAYRGDFASGIHSYEVANSGSRASYLADAAASLWAGSMDLIQPDLLVIEFGINEMQMAIPVQDFISNLNLLEQRVRAGAVNVYTGAAPYAPSVLLLNMWAIGSGTWTEADWAPYRYAIHRAADRSNWAVADIHALTGYIGNDPYGITTDQVHPNTKGKEMIADEISRLLLS